jgi:hypothetical protein
MTTTHLRDLRRFPKEARPYALALLERYDHAFATYFDVHAPYQRGSVWSIAQRQALIDTMLMGLAIPAIYVRELDLVDRPRYEVIDGKQRLLALAGFMADEFTVDGCFFSQWSAVERRMWSNEILPVIVVGRISDAEAVEVYRRLNTCGTPHRPDELPAIPESVT